MSVHGSAAPRETPQVVVVGAAPRDVDPQDPRGWRLGGGVGYGALLAGRLGARVGALIGVDQEASTATELDLLRRAGVDVEVVPLANGPLFENIATPIGRHQICHGVSDPIHADRLPVAWRSAPSFLVAPVAGEIADEWADVLPADAVVALSWQGLLRSLASGEPVRPLPATPHPLVTRADLVGVSHEDLRAGGGQLLDLISTPGHEMALTGGDLGAIHFERRSEAFRLRRIPAVPARRLGDLVGAGDAFLTTWLLARLAGGPFGPRRLTTPRALHVAAIVASLTTEGIGLPGLPDAVALRERLVELVAARPARA